jgi:hypothetical protein
LNRGRLDDDEGFVKVEKIRPDHERTKGFKEIKSPEHEKKTGGEEGGYRWVNKPDKARQKAVARQNSGPARSVSSRR